MVVSYQVCRKSLAMMIQEKSQLVTLLRIKPTILKRDGDVYS